MSTAASPEAKGAEQLRAELAEKIRSMDETHLRIATDLLREIEMSETLAELDDAFDAARGEGRLSPEHIQAAIAAHRERHLYCGNRALDDKLTFASVSKPSA